MTLNAYAQVGFYIVLVLGLAQPLGNYMARVFDNEPTPLRRLLGPVEGCLYRWARIDPEQGMTWRTYAVAMLLFNFAGLLLTYALQRLQGVLPWNPQDLAAVSPGSAFNTAVSFATNTNWQGYAGESTMSYLTQALGLSVQNFLSAASGMATLLPLIRSLRQANKTDLGNYWVDLTRSVLYILLPLSLVWSLVLVSQGVVQTFSAYETASLVQPTTYRIPSTDPAGAILLDENGNPQTEAVQLAEQSLALGPVASQVAIKQLGTNGGGFFNANSAHPFENPTPLSNFFELLAILLIPAALCCTFGTMVGDRRQGWAILATMTLIFLGALAVCVWSEQQGTPQLERLGADLHASPLQAGGNMEGKEVRFGIVNSALWATATTAASNGSVNSMHDSFTPLGGLVPLFMMQLSEIIFGGVGSGLYGMLIFALVAVFVAGLMVGRTPEYLGKKIEAYEMKMAGLILLIPPVLVLGFTAVAVTLPAALASRANSGAHGFTEILYAISSMANNNGSAFAGLSANVPFYNLCGGLAMLAGRYWLAIPTLAIAGSLARKKKIPVSPGTLPTHTPLFVALLIGVVFLVGALTFAPSLALGPLVEHLLMLS